MAIIIEVLECSPTFIDIESVDIANVKRTEKGYYGDLIVYKKDGTKTTESAVDAAFFPGRYGFCLISSEE